ncbi:hypothetical protein [uncultured Ruminococcus sp.]|uniref:hypothetical protein n=1 Tax=uncultured Ruminococcus sp. TaxID=165186 RepID=UPI0025D6A3EB|nr:hypothetical protein [uncultured Ruminococcus sp.]
MKKTLFSILLAGAVMTSFFGCGTEQTKSENNEQTETTTKTEEISKEIEDVTQEAEETALKTESTTTVETTTTQASEPELADITIEEMKLKISATWERSNDAPYLWYAEDRSNISITTVNDISFKNFSNTDLLSVAVKATDEHFLEDAANGKIYGYNGYSYETYDGIQAAVMDYTLVNDDYDTTMRAVIFAYDATEYLVIAQLTVHEQPSDVSIKLDDILNSIQFSSVNAE